MAQTDITLAGMQVSGNELDDPASGISLTPDQDENPQWASVDARSYKHTLETDRSGRHGNHQPLDRESSRSTRSITPSTFKTVGLRTRQDSLKVLADVASDRASVGTPHHRPLSDAPQTKAEQQEFLSHTEQERMALQKFGMALIAKYEANPPADGADLAHVVSRFLSGTMQQFLNPPHGIGSARRRDGLEEGSSREDTVMTRSEALKASQAISHLVKQSLSPPNTMRSRRSSKVSSPDKLQCTRCDVVLARACDMKKHMKRHTKPYGCTYPRCHKRFGAKSDWKRHENSQHFQMEAFRCQTHCTAGSSIVYATCGELFYRIELFKQHLMNEHKISEEAEVGEEVKTCRIGKNYQGQFWCGFCESIVKLKEKRNAAWDERFDHIDKHFNKEKRGIEQWLCVEARKTKGDIQKDMDRRRFSEQEDEEDGEGESDDSPPADAGMSGDGFEMDECMRPPDILPSIPMVGDLLRKRQYPGEDFAPPPVPKRRRIDVDRYCVSRF